MAFLGVYGHVNVDFILQVPDLPGPDQTVPVTRELRRLGGTGGNLARAAASLGVPTALAAWVGDDFPPEFRAQLESGGIDLTDLQGLPGPTPKIWILNSQSGAQAAVIEQGVMGDGFTRPHRDHTMLQSQWVHFTTGPPPEYADLALEAARARKRVAFDPAQELSYRYSDRLLERFLDQTDLFFVNEVELARALKKLGYGAPEQLLDHTEAVLETRGSRGCRLYTRDGRVDVPPAAARIPPGTDTVGAGDVFRAGVYAALQAGKALPEAARWGNTAAALYLEGRAETFPTRAHVAARLDPSKS